MVGKVVRSSGWLSVALLADVDSASRSIRSRRVALRVAKRLANCIFRFAHAALLPDGSARVDR
jgi:hypothetical protein